MPNSPHPWDDGVYVTGRTQPPKNHGGLIAVLLILIIFLTGIVTALGVMNVRLFRQLHDEQAEEENAAIAFAAEQAPAEAETEAVSVPETVAPEAAEMDINLDLRALPEVEAEEIAELSLQDIYERCIPSVVSVVCNLRSGTSTGSGVILSADGFVATNYHVIENAVQIAIQLSDDRILDAKLVGKDPATDLAVLLIEAEGLVPAELGNSDVLRVGDNVVAIGDPLGIKYRGTMTNGIVSAINRNVNVNGRNMNLIQTNAALNTGNSGGPLINAYGQVIGINTMKIVEDAYGASGVEGIGFAIPTTVVKDIVSQIISQGYVSGRPSLGVEGEYISIFYQRYYRLPSGLFITSVSPDSQAAQQGIQEGDILIAVDDTKVYTMEDLNTLLYNYNAGDLVSLTVYREGQVQTIQLVLEEAKG